MPGGGWPLDEKPILVFWETTKACLLKCKHCRAQAITEPLPGELSTREAMALVDQVLEFGRPYPILVLTGGDPLMRGDFWEIVEYASSQGLRVAVAPSVTPLLTREAVARMARSGVRAASLSLDSPYPEVHDSIRGVEGTWKRTVEAIRWFREEGISVQVNTVVMRDTVEGLADMVKLLLDLGVGTWEVFYLVPTGRATMQLDLTPQEWEDVSHFLYEASKYGLLVRTTEGPMFRRAALVRMALEARGAREALERLDSSLGPLYRRLKARLRELLGEPPSSRRPGAHTFATRDGRGIVFIDYKGNVYPSGFLPVPAGNVRLKSLREIYRESTLFKLLRRGDSLKGRCGRCEFRWICGGSRARAYAYHGDPLAEDPACPYEPGSYRGLLEEAGVEDPSLWGLARLAGVRIL
ncbi:MAG: TIGR04053 family radical SAM/SPASM domain-containing protein [Desulfurococcales archaeon]|nr:TIGR04053 family radical SAM/SPASM domain-containing protein [Desulfurococcales archaeon]